MLAKQQPSNRLCTNPAIESIRRLRAYMAHPDPLVAAANLVAFMVGVNMPFYSLFAVLAAGTGGLPSTLLTSCATSFFLALPAVARSHPRAGRALLPIVGTLNTLFSTWVLGESSGTQMFFLPVSMAAALIFRRHEAWLMLPLIGLPLAAFLAFEGNYAAPPYVFDATAAHALVRMNAIGVAGLTAFIGLIFSNLRARPENPALPLDKNPDR